MFCVPCKDLPGGMLNSLDLPCIQTSFSWSRLNSTIRNPRRTGRFFFSWLSWCAIWMKFTIKQFHAVAAVASYAHKGNGTLKRHEGFFLNLGPLWLESYWFTVILEPFFCYWLMIIWILPSAEATPTQKSELPIMYSVYTKHLSR